MNVLRNERQAVLAALHALGEALVERLDDLREGGAVSDPLRGVLGEVRAARAELVAELGRAQERSGELPHAGNREWAALQSLGDRFAHLARGEGALVRRLLDGDQVWAEELRAAREGDWEEEDARLLARLANHLAETRARLQPYTDEDPAP